MAESVSVVVPFYNDSETIARAIESVLCQTLPPLELLIVDDCSAEREVLALHRILEEGSKGSTAPVRVISTDSNGGPASARNAGWSQARGTWVAFLDADDEWLPRKLERQLQVAARHPSVVLWGSLGVQVMEGSSGEDVEERAFPPVKWVGFPGLLFRNPFATSAVILKDLPNFVFDESMRYSEDYDLWIRVVSVGGKAGVIQEAHYVRHEGPGGHVGLSANLVQMELGEIRAILRARLPSKLHSGILPVAVAYSALRFCRRVLLQYL